jgi:predicted RNA-binding Zn-ribbon protein involved in translation (DUF1610 family)
MSVKVAECRTCGRDLHAGERAWEVDATVMFDFAGRAVSRTVEYECDECGAD